MTFTLGNPKMDEVWRTIDYEVTWLHGRWAIYRQLYGTNEARVDALNQAASTFAYMLQDMLLDDIQLGLAKLGDRAYTQINKTTQSENLTLPYLKELTTQSGVLIAGLPPLLQDYKDACAAIRESRNKRIAHFDLSTMLGANTRPLSQPSREEIENALKALRNFMNCIAQHFGSAPTGYEYTALDNDGDSLITTLKKGLRYDELVKERRIPFDDLSCSGWGNI